MKNIRIFYLNIFQFLEVKFSIYLKRQVFEAVLTSTTIYVFSRNVKNISFLSEYFSVFGGEIFYIFE